LAVKGDFTSYREVSMQAMGKEHPEVGHYVSYCGKVDSIRKNSERVNGKGNTKNGNRYLAWAISKAAEYARRVFLEIKA